MTRLFGPSIGKAEEAIHFYISQFPNSKIDMIARDEKTQAVLHSTLDWAKMISEADPRQRERLMSALLKMKKPDLRVLQSCLR